VLMLFAAAIMLIAWLHRYVLVVLAYTYLASAFVGMAITRFRHRGGRQTAGEPAAEQPERGQARRSV
jgi:hypothetical protein